MSDETRRIFRLPSARDSVEREVEDEIRFHIETRSQELERDGMTPAAAQEQARREFGDAAAARTELRRSTGTAYHAPSAAIGGAVCVRMCASRCGVSAAHAASPRLHCSLSRWASAPQPRC